VALEDQKSTAVNGHRKLFQLKISAIKVAVVITGLDNGTMRSTLDEDKHRFVSIRCPG
jgi:hypothetical protein